MDGRTWRPNDYGRAPGVLDGIVYDETTPVYWEDLDFDLLPQTPPRTSGRFRWDGSPWTGRDAVFVLSDGALQSWLGED